MTIYWDLDGVLRDLVGAYQGVYDKLISVWGDLDIAKVTPKMLEFAPPTEYLDMILNFFEDNTYNLNIASCQPHHWRETTDKWIERNIGDIEPIYFNTSQEKVLHCRTDILVEDSPNLTSYGNVCLVRRPWNVEIPTSKCFHVVRNKMSMHAFLVICHNILSHETRISPA